MKTIIASTDFSPVSLNAVNYAADMAMEVNADLLLLNVFNLPVVYSDGPVIALPVEDLLKDSEVEVEKLKTDMFARTKGKVRITTRSRMGNVTEELEDLCKTIKPFAVVIGSRGKTNFEKTIFGSAALSIIKHLNWPVLCIPPGKEYGKGIRSIGFACDLKEVGETIPEATIKELVNEFKAEFHILNVDYENKRFSSGTIAESFALHEMFLKEKPHYHFINNEDFVDGINLFANENKLDLIITIPKKHKLFEKIFKSSHTKQMLAISPVPLMCIHQ